MFSKRAERYLRKTVENVNRWGTLPFSWDGTNNRLQTVTSRGRKFLWYLHILAQAAHFLFLTGRYVEYKFFKKSASPSMRMYCEYAMVSYSIPLVFQLCILLRLHQLTGFIHDFTGLYPKIQEKFGVKASVGKDCDRFLMFMMRSGKLICYINVVILFRKPGRPVLLTSLLTTDPTKLRPWHIAPFAVPHIFVWWSMWTCLHLWSIYMMTYVFSTIEILRSLAKRPGEVTPKNFAQVYRCLQLLQKKHAEAYGLTLALHKILFALVVIRSIYSTLVMHGEVRILLAVVGLSTWFYLHVAFHTLGKVNTVSKEALAAWKRAGIVDRGHWRWFRRFHQSCPVLKVRIGSFYFVDRGVPLTLATIIMDSIVNLLLAHKEQLKRLST